MLSGEVRVELVLPDLRFRLYQFENSVHVNLRTVEPTECPGSTWRSATTAAGDQLQPGPQRTVVVADVVGLSARLQEFLRCLCLTPQKFGTFGNFTRFTP